MKYLKYLAVGICVAFAMAGCKKVELKDYDGKEGVYFYVQYGNPAYDTTYWTAHSYTPVNFANIIGDRYETKFRVMITGRVKDYDRTFRVGIDADSTTAVEGVHYEPFPTECTVKAGWTYGDVQVTLLRSEDISKEMKKLRLKLIPSEDFDISFDVWYKLSGMLPLDPDDMDFDPTYHEIRMSDFLSKPPVWSGGYYDQPGDQEMGRFGVFTEKKFRLMCELMELTYDDFTSEETMPDARQQVIQNFMTQYLQRLYDAGTPVLEEDGRLMWFMGVSWTSIVGVPWVPSN